MWRATFGPRAASLTCMPGLVDILSNTNSLIKAMPCVIHTLMKSLCLEYAAVDNVLSSSDYKKVGNVVDLLKLLYNVTIALQKKSNITAGELFKHWCK